MKMGIFAFTFSLSKLSSLQKVKLHVQRKASFSGGQGGRGGVRVTGHEAGKDRVCVQGMPKPMARELVRIALDLLPTAIDDLSSSGQRDGGSGGSTAGSYFWDFALHKASTGSGGSTAGPLLPHNDASCKALAWFPRLVLFHVHAGHPSATAPLLAALASPSTPRHPILAAMNDATLASLAKPLSLPLGRASGMGQAERSLISAVVAEVAERDRAGRQMELGYAVRWAMFVADHALSLDSASAEKVPAEVPRRQTEPPQPAAPQSGWKAALGSAMAGWFDSDPAAGIGGGAGSPAPVDVSALARKLVLDACLRAGSMAEMIRNPGPSNSGTVGNPPTSTPTGDDRGNAAAPTARGEEAGWHRGVSGAAVGVPVMFNVIMGLARRALALKIQDCNCVEALVSAFGAALPRMNSGEAVDAARMVCSVMASALTLEGCVSATRGAATAIAAAAGPRDLGGDDSLLMLEVLAKLCSKAFTDLPSLQPDQLHHLLLSLATFSDHVGDLTSIEGSLPTIHADISLLARRLEEWYASSQAQPPSLRGLHRDLLIPPSEGGVGPSEGGVGGGPRGIRIHKDHKPAAGRGSRIRDALEALSACVRLNLTAHSGLISALERQVVLGREVERMSADQVRLSMSAVPCA